MRTVALADVCDIIVGRTPPRADPSMWGTGQPWVSIADMNQGLTIRHTKEQITAAAYAKGRPVPEGTVLLSFKLSIGKVARAGMSLFTNEAIAALPIKDEARLSAAYLLRALQAQDLTGGSNRAAMGMTLNKAALQSIRILLPGLEEQRRIAATLGQADAIRTQRRQVLAHLDLLPRSLYSSLIHRHTVEWVRLEEMVRTSSGGTPNRKRSDFFGGPIPWVKSGELHQDLISDTEETLTQAGIEQSSASLLPVGTVVMAMYGATAGAVSRLGVDAATNQAVCAFHPGEAILPGYLMWSLRSQTHLLLSRRSGGAQPNLSQGTIRSLSLPVPALAVQREFEENVTQVAHERERLEVAAAADDELFSSLQSRAFRGQL